MNPLKQLFEVYCEVMDEEESSNSPPHKDEFGWLIDVEGEEYYDELAYLAYWGR